MQQVDQCCITATEPGTSLFIDGKVTGSERGLDGQFCVSFHGKNPFMLKGTLPETQNVTKQLISIFHLQGETDEPPHVCPKCDYIILIMLSGH